MTRKLAVLTFTIVVVTLLSVCLCYADNWPGTDAVDFPIRVVPVQVTPPPGFSSYTVDQVQVQTNRPINDGWLPLKKTKPGMPALPNFTDLVKTTLSGVTPPTNTAAAAALRDLQAVPGTGVATATKVRAGVTGLARKRCFIVDKGNHPIWLRVRGKMKAGAGTVWKETDQWYAGSGTQGSWKFETYFVTVVTMYVPVKTSLGTTVTPRKVKVIVTPPTKTEYIRRWVDP